MSRSLWEWKDQITHAWDRLSTFMRICVGFGIAIGMAYLVINDRVKPLQMQVEELNEETKADGAPARVPEPDDDDELQETKLRIESMEKTTQKKRKKLARTITKHNIASEEDEGQVVGEFDRMVYESDLNALSRKRLAKKTAAEKLMVARYHYLLEGEYDGIYAFLSRLNDFPHLSRLSSLSIQTPEPKRNETEGARTRDGTKKDSPVDRRPELHLEFDLHLFLTAGEAP
ncbi:MAG: hypothetical protein ACLFT2_01930 [Candidatus Brocadiia bacterium]